MTNVGKFVQRGALMCSLDERPSLGDLFALALDKPPGALDVTDDPDFVLLV